MSRLFDFWNKKYLRLRHRKGHGVHSPYVYSVVREVFMRSKRASVDLDYKKADLYQDLVACSLSERYLCELVMLFEHCTYKTYSFTKLDCEVLILTKEHTKLMSEQEEMAIINLARENGMTLVLLDTEKFDRWSQRHHSTSIDREEYLILFNNHLPKQHFVL